MGWGECESCRHCFSGDHTCIGCKLERRTDGTWARSMYSPESGSYTFTTQAEQKGGV